MTERNQNPEQIARDKIDTLLETAGWRVQSNRRIDFNAGLGIAVREYQTAIGPADYVLFVDKKAVGVIEAKPEDWGHRITTVELQSGGYASATLKWVNNKQPLPFIYESTGVITRFTDGRDPKPRSREVLGHAREDLDPLLRQPGLLLRLAQRRELGRRVVRLDPPAGEADLPGMRLEVRGALREEHRQATGVIDDRHQDRRLGRVVVEALRVVVGIDREGRRAALRQTAAELVNVHPGQALERRCYSSPRNPTKEGGPQ